MNEKGNIQHARHEPTVNILYCHMLCILYLLPPMNSDNELKNGNVSVSCFLLVFLFSDCDQII